MLIDKVDSAHDIKISSEIGMQMPVLAGAGIKAMLSLLSDQEIDRLLSTVTLKRYTPNTIIDLKRYKDEIKRVREEGLAFDREEYIEGMVAVGVPLRTKGRQIEAAIWAVGLKHQTSPEAVPNLNPLLKQIVEDINRRL